MSRVIKFRAWDDKHKSMVNWEQALRNFKMDEFFVSVDDFKLMQFTGLTDKNGEEIYEGDIIAYEEKDNIAKVEYINAGFYLNFKQNITSLGPDIRIEVIGNIYENPELLTKEKGEYKYE